MLANTELQGIPLLVLANKMDLEVRTRVLQTDALLSSQLICCMSAAVARTLKV